MALANIWRNRIEAGTQRLQNCPASIKDNVINLIKNDIISGSFTKEQLDKLLVTENVSIEDYDKIIEGI